MSWVATKALIEAGEGGDSQHVRMVALFDNEEIGSLSTMGADSDLLPTAMKRIWTALGGTEASYEPALKRSFVVSADMAHACHPTYSFKHEVNHRPAFSKGLVIKQNANMRYATTMATSMVIKLASRIAEVPIQEFVVKNDSPCGSTIGNMVSAKLGIPCVDVGIPQLSMHSIREVAHVADLDSTVHLFVTLFQQYAKISSMIDLD